MKNKEIIMKLRTQNKIKGKRPAIVTVDPNFGKMYPYKSKAKYIISIDDNNIYFQYITKIFKNSDEKKDLTFRIKEFKTFGILDKMAGVIKLVTLYKKDGNFFEFRFVTYGKDSYDTNVNIDYLLRKLESNNIKCETKVSEAKTNE